MKQEVLDVNTAIGWWDKPVSFGKAMGLLHSEVAEATQAWRQWGLDDRTPQGLTPATEKAYAHLNMPVPAPMRKLPKPEGVGSEFADIIIRLLDDDARYNLWLDYFWDNAEPFLLAVFDDPDDFIDNMDTLHRLIAIASTAHDAEVEYEGADSQAGRDSFGNVIVLLRQLAKMYGIDLAAEYRRKIDFNKTREYRHGNRRA